MTFLALLVHRCLVACKIFPTAAGLIETGLLLVGLVLTAYLFGWLTGFLSLQYAPLSLRNIVLLLIATFFFPALGEEIIFRALPLPLPTEGGELQRLIWSVISLIAFVLYHPVRAWIWPRKQYRVFLDGRFLVLASLLGLFCTLAYVISGSIWPPVLIHWLSVVIWLLFLGGYQRFEGKHRIKRLDIVE